VKFILALFALFLAGVSAYPVPVDCRGVTHQPLAEMVVIQDFGHLNHVGVDYVASTGTKVYSMLDGIVVIAADDNRVYGRHVMILQCDGYAPLYGHLSSLDVKFGQVVSAGDIIGLSGGGLDDPNRGMNSGPHLHFEIRVPGHLDNNLYNINPVIYWDLVHRVGELPEER